MPTSKDKDIILIRSQEVQELIGHIPGGFMRYGIGLILVLLIAALLACSFIPYRDTQSFPLRVLPNVPSQCIRSPFDGNIAHCYVEEGAVVSPGDTLISMNVDGQLHYLKATARGKIKLCSFCAPNESIRKGQSLLEICDYSCMPKFLMAIADTLPETVPVGQIQTIELNIGGHVVPFKLVRIIEDKESCKKQGLFQSESCIGVTRQHLVEGKVVTDHGVLSDKLIQVKWQPL